MSYYLNRRIRELSELDPDRFWEVVDLVQRRAEDPDAQAALEQEEDIAAAWENLQQSFATTVRNMNRAFRSQAHDHYHRSDLRKKSWRNKSRFFVGPDEGLYSPHLALFLGELKRVMALDDEELAVERLVEEPALNSFVKETLEDEADLEALYPLIRAAHSAISRPARPTLDDEDEGMEIDRILEIVELLGQLQERAGLRDRDRRVSRSLTRSTELAHRARDLAGPDVLDPSSLPRALQDSYDELWNVSSRYAKTRTPQGAFVDGMRERVKANGPADLLVVMAASSDGTDREVAGFSPHTPEVVYKKMIYDNAQHVLDAVVQNERFNDQLAYAMMETNLPKQLTSVMLYGNVDLGVRVMAAERCIAHDGVDPVDIYTFLRNNSHHPDVPDYLWRDFVEAVNGRLTRLRARQAELDDDTEEMEELEELEHRLERMSSSAMEDLMRPYWKALQELEREKERKQRHEERDAAHSYYVSGARRRTLEEHREFVDRCEFIKDPDFLDLMLEGITDDDELVDLLTYCVKADLPVTKKLTVNVMQHESPEVRQTGVRLMPNLDDEEVERMAAELEESIQADHEAVREDVAESVLPDYEPVYGVARKRNARKWPHFLAARTHSLEELVDTYVHCYETDPRTMFNEFRRLTMRRNLAERLGRRLDEAGDVDWSATPEDLDEGPVEQADLFGEIGGGGDGPGMMESRDRDAPQHSSR